MENRKLAQIYRLGLATISLNYWQSAFYVQLSFLEGTNPTNVTAEHVTPLNERQHTMNRIIPFTSQLQSKKWSGERMFTSHVYQDISRGQLS